MTYFVNFRATDYGAVLNSPQLFESFGTPPTARLMDAAELARAVDGKDLVFATHGFNVGYIAGLQTLANLDTALGLSPSLVVGVLWPGDWVIPAVNYPFAVGIARLAGRRLGKFIAANLSRAASVSFISHSLGARVVLEAVAQLDRSARVVCLAAAAVNADCLSGEYAASATDVAAVTTLASPNDSVLKLSYPAGDLFADILHLDHEPFRRALGLLGPTPPVGPNVAAHEIGATPPYDHGDYLPPAGALPAAPSATKWYSVTQFMRRAVLQQPQLWP